MQLPALTIAKYFLSQSEEIDNPKLNALLYLAQGYFLAQHKQPLFRENVEYWACGPTVGMVHFHYNQHVGRMIPREIFTEHFTDKRVYEVLGQVWSQYGLYTSDALVEWVKKQSPCMNTRTIGRNITRRSMKQFFEELLKELLASKES